MSRSGGSKKVTVCDEGGENMCDVTHFLFIIHITPEMETVMFN